MRSARAFLIAAAVLALPATVPAAAQSVGGTPCVLDKCLSGNGGEAPASGQPAPNAGQTAPGPGQPGSRPYGRDRLGAGPPAPGQFDFYVLSLSWSPGFCDLGGDRKAPQQCGDGASLGFVVHGLWPQNDHGFPSDCDKNTASPPRAALQSAEGLYPDIGLARHEWRKHGTCTGLDPAAYFAAVRTAREGITIPDTLTRPSEPQNLSPNEVARAFMAANRGLRPGMLAVTCRQNELQEVRLCLSKNLRDFVPCPEVSRAACRAPSISVLPVR